MGCTRVLVGHSERRHTFGETNAQTGLKVLTARNAGLLPILCVGETLLQREEGIADSTIIKQLASGMEHLKPDQISGFVIAYEPVWAIGTGVVATPNQAQAMHQTIREWLGVHYPPFVATETKIIYGGSVKPANADDLLSCPDIDGALVGGASLNEDSFSDIVRAARRR
jgi:triosephosphate isomerase